MSLLRVCVSGYEETRGHLEDPWEISDSEQTAVGPDGLPAGLDAGVRPGAGYPDLAFPCVPFLKWTRLLSRVILATTMSGDSQLRASGHAWHVPASYTGKETVKANVITYEDI